MTLARLQIVLATVTVTLIRSVRLVVIYPAAGCSPTTGRLTACGSSLIIARRSLKLNNANASIATSSLLAPFRFAVDKTQLTFGQKQGIFSECNPSIQRPNRRAEQVMRQMTNRVNGRFDQLAQAGDPTTARKLPNPGLPRPSR